MFVETKEPSALPDTKVGPVEDALTKARAIIADERNWMKGSWCSGPGSETASYCSVGAVAKAIGILDENRVSENRVSAGSKKLYYGGLIETDRLSFRSPSRQLYKQVVTFLGARVEHKRHYDIVEMNDDPATRHAEIIAIFDKAIAEAKRRNI